MKKLYCAKLVKSENEVDRCVRNKTLLRCAKISYNLTRDLSICVDLPSCQYSNYN